MKRLTSYIIFTSLALCLGLASCSKEEALTPETDTRLSHFLPDPNATDTESVLRREFYDTYGSYLFFNDTLQHTPLGTDRDGNVQYFTELIDITYTTGSNVNVATSYTYEFLETTAEREAGLNLLKNEVLPHLEKFAYPFSWLVTGTIMEKAVTGDPKEVNAAVGERAIAIAVKGSDTATEEEKEKMAKSIIGTVLGKALESKTSELEAFYDVCDGIYGTFFENPTYSTDVMWEELKKAGFITPRYLFGSIFYRNSYPLKEDDMKSFVDLVFNYTEAEVNNTYKDYPVVLEKYNILKDLVKTLGYIE